MKRIFLYLQIITVSYLTKGNKKTDIQTQKQLSKGKVTVYITNGNIKAITGMLQTTAIVLTAYTIKAMQVDWLYANVHVRSARIPNQMTTYGIDCVSASDFRVILHNCELSFMYIFIHIFLFFLD